MTLSKEMKRFAYLMIWIAVLVGGAMAVGMVFKRTSQGGTGNGLGLFRYSYEFDLFPAIDDDPSFSHIQLNAEAPQRFKLYGGVSPKYETISMKWELPPGYEGRSEGHILINLTDSVIHDNGRTFDLNSDNLLKVTGVQDRSANRITIEYLRLSVRFA